MIKRYMLYAHANNNNINLIENDYHLSAARYGNDVFIYLETEHDENPFELADKFVKGDFSVFPNGEKYVEMTDIFHYSFPASEEYWRRKLDNKNLVFKIARLKNDRVGEYVYYHYKLQREATCQYDKYGIICRFFIPVDFPSLICFIHLHYYCHNRNAVQFILTSEL